MVREIVLDEEGIRRLMKVIGYNSKPSDFKKVTLVYGGNRPYAELVFAGGKKGKEREPVAEENLAHILGLD